jgi:hypothetical protein
MRAKCAALFMGAFFTHPLCAQTGLPIAFAVEENNRLFLNGDGLDFENDLHTYLHCVNPVKARSPECAEYVKQGTMHGELVPNLRRGPPFEEYATRYDKPRMQYRDEYVQNRMRRLTFTPREDAAAAAAKPGSKCSWTLQSVDGSSVAPVKQDCKAAVFDVELGQAATDAPLSFTGQVELAVVVPGAGSPEKFGIPVYSRDYLLVAFGDSFTARATRKKTSTAKKAWSPPNGWITAAIERSSRIP